MTNKIHNYSTPYRGLTAAKCQLALPILSFNRFNFWILIKILNGKKCWKGFYVKSNASKIFGFKC